VQRILLLVSVLLIPLFVKISSSLTITAFLISWGIFNLFVGSYMPFYMSIFKKVADNNQIGRLKGFSGASGNILAIGSAALVGIILKTLAYPNNYTLIFSAGAFLLILDAVLFWFFDEPSENITVKNVTHSEYLRDIPDILRSDRQFIKLVGGCVLFVISNISLVYYTLYAIRSFNAQANEVALFMSITVIVNIFGNILFGLFADHFTNRLVLILSASCGVAAGIIILSFNSLYAVYAAFILSSLCSCGFMLSGSILIMRCSPQNKISTYFLVYSVTSLVISSFITMLGGLLIDKFSFAPLFIITGIAAVGSLFVFLLIKPDESGNH